MTKFRESMTSKLKTLVEKHSVKKDAVDIGNSNRKWLSEIINTSDFSTLDLRSGFDLRKHNKQVKDDSFSTVFSICVLEHVPNPFIAVNEMHRILKPNGLIYVTVPFIYRFHEAPRDYWRFTSDGVNEIMKQFKTIEYGYFDGNNGVYYVGVKN